jgi:biotin operon repressor
MSVKHGSKWTDAEVNYLIENAGKKSLEQISQKLGRPYKSTVKKAAEFNLANGKLITVLFTASQLARVLGVAVSTVVNWTELMSLPFKWIKYRTSFQFKMINMVDFYEWAEAHQDILDTRKFKVPNLGNEPDWLREKRKHDAKLPKAYNRVWRRDEEQRLISLVNARVGKSEIGKLLNRSESGIQSKINRLKALGDLPIDKRGEFYSSSEEKMLLELKNQGLTANQIAQKLKRSKYSVHQKYRHLKMAGAVQ